MNISDYEGAFVGQNFLATKLPIQPTKAPAAIRPARTAAAFGSAESSARRATNINAPAIAEISCLLINAPAMKQSTTPIGSRSEARNVAKNVII